MYPCPRQYTNLRMMKVLHDKFDCPVGFSSHSTNIDIPLTAVLLGASVIEVHFTLNKKMKGPDHKASLNPKELKELVTRIKIEDFPLLDYAIMGSNIKRLTEEEERLSKIVRKSIYSFVNIPENTKITNKMLIIKRPGIGIPPKGIYTIIGKTTKHFIRKNTLIKMSDVK
jgi:sialic acid synthase SpsE